MSKVRHDTAVAKIEAVIEHLEEVLETQDKVVVFCHHHDVAYALHDHFGSKAAFVTGEVEPAKRMAQVDRFQDYPTCKLFIGGIQAAGVGLTLTAAQHVVFAELDWVPGNVMQAEDRLHRIGQRGLVLVQHLVFDDSGRLADGADHHRQAKGHRGGDGPTGPPDQDPAVKTGWSFRQAVALPVEEPEITRIIDINRPADDLEVPF